MTLLLFLIASLATFRLSLMVSKESGPAWMFLRLRRSVPKDSSVKEGIQCQWCVSMWAAPPVSAFVLWRESLPSWIAATGDWFLLMLALSGAAIAINQTFTKG